MQTLLYVLLFNGGGNRKLFCNKFEDFTEIESIVFGALLLVVVLLLQNLVTNNPNLGIGLCVRIISYSNSVKKGP